MEWTILTVLFFSLGGIFLLIKAVSWSKHLLIWIHSRRERAQRDEPVQPILNVVIHSAPLDEEEEVKTDSVDEFYKNDAAYQKMQQELRENCAATGMTGHPRKLLSNMICTAYHAYHEGQSAEVLLQRYIEKQLLDVVLGNIDERDVTEAYRYQDTKPSDPVEGIAYTVIGKAESMVGYWEQPEYYSGLDLMEEVVMLYLREGRAH
jgi:hypothetical protein